MGTPSTPNRAPRPDAQPFPWGELTEEQRTCLEALLAALDGYASRTLAADVDNKRGRLLNLPRVDEHRWSNIYLIDGARGSGKTTVLLVLLKACAQALRGEPLEEKLHALAAARVLRGKLLPTRILDLQPLPADAQLITWIATRLLEVLDAAEEDAPTGRRPSAAEAPGRWEPGHVEASEARCAWMKFAEAVAGGWEGNLAQRKDKLDPEAWAIELERTERERMSLTHCWRRTVDLILAAAHEAHPRAIDRDVRLLVPIDDADMNPQRSVELLEVLRMLWHPRVVFLLTGDTGLFQTTLQVHYEGVFHKVGVGAKFGTQTGQDFQHTAAALKRALYEKLLPRGHRFELKPLSLSGRVGRVRDALNSVTVIEGSEPVTLETYLKIDEWLGYALPEYLRPLLEQGEALTGNTAAEGRDRPRSACLI